MGKRTKYVYTSSSQVYHLWANQSQESARQGGSMRRSSFESTSCYSYQAEIGRFVTYKGKRIALVSNHKYSHTTLKHQNEVWDAVEGQLRLRVSSMHMNVRDALVETQDKLLNKIFDQFSRRTFYHSFEFWTMDSWIGAQIHEFNKLCRELKHHELLLDIPQDLVDLFIEHRTYCIARRVELDAGAEERRAKKEAA